MISFLVDFSKEFFFQTQEYLRLCGTAVRGIVTKPFYLRDTVEQFYSIGVGSLVVVVLTGFFTGAVLALQTGMTLDQFGARPFVGRLVSASMVRELGPVLTGLMLAGRVGSGIAAELGSMVVTDQINALVDTSLPEFEYLERDHNNIRFLMIHPFNVSYVLKFINIYF